MPDTFGGHKANAIDSSKKAIEQLKKALQKIKNNLLLTDQSQLTSHQKII